MIDVFCFIAFNCFRTTNGSTNKNYYAAIVNLDNSRNVKGTTIFKQLKETFKLNSAASVQYCFVDHAPWSIIQHISQSCGQPNTGPLLFSYRARWVPILYWPSGDKRLSEPCLSPESNSGPVAWQCHTLITKLPGLHYNLFISSFCFGLCWRVC